MTREARWQAATVTLLFLGYGGYYFCRADLAVATPLILDELRASGLDAATAQVRIGTMASLGVLAYAIGKLTLAGFADFHGGKRNFVGGLAGALVFTLLFAASGSLPFFTLAWIGNRFLQSAGWAGLVKVSSRWIDFSSYGTVLGLLSVSFLVGDAVARQVMGAMLAAGFGWRALFVLAAAVVAVLLVLNVLFLRESRTELGFAPPKPSPVSVFGDASDTARPTSVRELLAPFARSPAFWLICGLSLGTTLVRETFNTWTPTYLTQFTGMSGARAAVWSSVFPAVGVVSVLLAGWLGDQLGARGRSQVMASGLFVAALGLGAMALLPPGGSGIPSGMMLGLVAFGLIGPYSYLAGATAIDFGGSRGAATASGLIDGIGYLGAVLAGDTVARISVAFGWGRAFGLLAVVCLICAAAAARLFAGRRLTA